MVRGSGCTPPKRTSPGHPDADLFGDALRPQRTLQSRLWVATEPVDCRTGIDGLAAVCRCALGDTPRSGALSVFRNRAGTTRTILAYDG